ncbi:MAG: ABC transporter ATP-binding protein, partial [Acidobacteria bacterium]|nr:ABC transporter ATP-binding protein [Acidobacteriota bacterium]
EGISKHYRIGNQDMEWYKTLRDTLTNAATFPLRALRSRLQGAQGQGSNGSTSFWALKDVTFEIKPGEIVGLIGHNGAGKSTLLKILSRITDPTEGYVEMYGRLSSLLEVGTGFNAELTGRENILLNGAILGMKRAEIKRKFDEIVAFAEVEKFIDTPVKRYSSGMYLRLAFAVAAHLEPEILLVDEVLAVGDAAFQKKCLGKMGEVAHQGRTVVLVSHNMAAITNLCSRTAVLRAGRLDFFGDTQRAVAEYLEGLSTGYSDDLAQRADRVGEGRARIQKLTLLNEYGAPKDVIQSGESLTVAMEYLSSEEKPLKNAFFEVSVFNQYGQQLFILSSFLTGQFFDILPGRGTVYCHVPAFLVTPDIYSTTVNIYVKNQLEDLVANASRLTVVEGDFFGSGNWAQKKIDGTFVMPQTWGETLPSRSDSRGNDYFLTGAKLG